MSTVTIKIKHKSVRLPRKMQYGRSRFNRSTKSQIHISVENLQANFLRTSWSQTVVLKDTECALSSEVHNPYHVHTSSCTSLLNFEVVLDQGGLKYKI